MLCRLYTLAEFIWRESRARVARDETGRVRLSTLLPRALNPREARARRGHTDESENKTRVGEGYSHACWLKWVGLKWLLPVHFVL